MRCSPLLHQILVAGALALHFGPSGPGDIRHGRTPARVVHPRQHQLDGLNEDGGGGISSDDEGLEVNGRLLVLVQSLDEGPEVEAVAPQRRAVDMEGGAAVVDGQVGDRRWLEAELRVQGVGRAGPQGAHRGGNERRGHSGRKSIEKCQALRWWSAGVNREQRLWRSHAAQTRHCAVRDPGASPSQRSSVRAQTRNLANGDLLGPIQQKPCERSC